MTVDLLFYRKNIEPKGDIIEMKIWQVPHSKDKPHGLKYSLVYIGKAKEYWDMIMQRAREAINIIGITSIHTSLMALMY